MRLPARPTPILIALLAGSAAAAALTIGACSDPDTQSPTCTNNVDEGGIHPVTGGCEQFAQCAGAPVDCCKDDAGVAFTGNDLATCLYGYGGCVSLEVTTDGTNISYVCSDGGGGGGSNGDGG